MSKEGRRTGRMSAWSASQREKLQHQQQKLEQHRQIGFLLQSSRRFKEIEGKHLALVIAVNLFIAVIPLLIIIYAFAASFSPHRSFGALAVKTCT